MNTDLIAVARTLAERGWLPGIAYLGENSGFWYSSGKPLDNHAAVEADLHLAAIKRVREINGTVLFGTLFVKLMVHDPTGIRMAKTYDADTKQGDTLALLRCLLVASEAQEVKQ